MNDEFLKPNCGTCSKSAEECNVCKNKKMNLSLMERKLTTALVSIIRLKKMILLLSFIAAGSNILLILHLLGAGHGGS